MDEEKFISKIKLDLVNKIIEKSFGKGFKGNYNDNHPNLREGNSLEYIARKIGAPIIYCINNKWECAGRFFKQDGSELQIFEEKYKDEAETYARLYNGIMEKEVEIHYPKEKIKNS